MRWWLSLALLTLTVVSRGQDIVIPEIRDDVAPADRTAIELSLRRSAGVATHGVDESAPYTFFPMSGIPNVDLLFSNAVDLDPAPESIRDFNCNQATYDGHQGHDMLMLTFRQQDIGTPVYAVSDGTVVAVRDGEPDRNTSWVAGTPSNYVVIRHGPRTTYYFHLRKGSVAVSVNQVVTAGTQLGLAASSGISNWPHLHFESRNATSHFEPSAGPCRPGASFWKEQPPIGAELIVHELAMSTQRFDAAPMLEDPAPRTGTFVRGTAVPVNFRIFLGSVPALSSYRLRVLRPDGSAAFTQQAPMNNPRLAMLIIMTRALTLDLTTEGKWTLVLDLNGRELFAAPFEVVASPSLVVNRAPEPIEARLVPPRPGPDDVARCEVVVSSLALEDPDYDVLAYRYEWNVAGSVVRTVTSAQLMDVLPKGTVAHGDVVTCSVTPSDGQLSGPTATATSLPLMRRRPTRH